MQCALVNATFEIWTVYVCVCVPSYSRGNSTLNHNRFVSMRATIQHATWLTTMTMMYSNMHTESHNNHHISYFTEEDTHRFTIKWKITGNTLPLVCIPFHLIRSTDYDRNTFPYYQLAGDLISYFFLNNMFWYLVHERIISIRKWQKKTNQFGKRIFNWF